MLFGVAFVVALMLNLSLLAGGQPKLLACLIWLHINFIKVKILGVEPKLIVPTNINPKFAGAEYCRLDFPECYF